MPDQPPDAERELQKLGQRIRDGFAQENAAPQRSLNTVRDAIHQQWQKDRAATPLTPPPSAPCEVREREPEA